MLLIHLRLVQCDNSCRKDTINYFVWVINYTLMDKWRHKSQLQQIWNHIYCTWFPTRSFTAAETLLTSRFSSCKNNKLQYLLKTLLTHSRDLDDLRWLRVKFKRDNKALPDFADFKNSPALTLLSLPNPSRGHYWLLTAPEPNCMLHHIYDIHREPIF